MKYIMFVFLLFSVSVNAQLNDVKIIVVPGAPLDIVKYEATYQEDSRYSNEGVRHSVTLKNNGTQAVVAYGVGFFAFDAFNRSMGRPLTGIDMDTVSVGAEGGGTWNQRPSAAFTFKSYGTGVAYLRQARLADGTIWHADMEYVLRELQGIENGLSMDDIVPE